MNEIESLTSKLAKAEARIFELEKSSTANLVFLNIFNSSPVPFSLYDEAGNILNVNTAFTQLFGYELEDVPQLTDWWHKAYPDPKYREWVISTWSERISRSQNTKNAFEPFEVKIRCKNGSQRIVLAEATLLTQSYEGIHLVMLYDITEIHQARYQIGDLSTSLEQMSASLQHQHAELIREKENAIANEERLRYAMQGANDGLWDWEIAHGTIYFSPRWKSMLGYAEDEIENSVPAWEALLHPDDLNEALANIEVFLAKKVDKYEAEFRMRHKDGSYINILSRAFAVESEAGEITRLVGTHVDVTERKAAEAQLKYLSSHDSLTGLVNRREFEERVESLLSTCIDDTQQHALCYLDLDQFKVVNDTCGHAAGDEMLRQLSFELHQKLRAGDTLARLGGDEFGVLIKNCSLDEARRFTGMLQDTLQEYQFIWETRSFRVGASIGLVQITNKTLNLTELFKDADVACYIAKDNGRNRIHVHSDDDAELVKRQGEIQWVTRIQEALDHERYCLYAQAIESLNKDIGAHYELLIRMLDQDGNIIPPGAFLPAAERYNLSVKLDRWVVNHAINLLEEHATFLESVDFISINLSGPSLTDEAFLEFAIQAVSALKSNSTKICFEITETAAISNILLAGKFIDELRSYGCRFALDDFGSGLSSFAYLKNLPVDYLKIDGAFVKDIVDDPIDRAMVKSINEIGQVMNMQTIAEFVENDHIKDMLKNIGVDYVQGYGIHKPQPFKELLNDFQSTLRNK
jgi:diguanylate cyclase (GGDEF)-like protein/PAS domain S-box-containing protein